MILKPLENSYNTSTQYIWNVKWQSMIVKWQSCNFTILANLPKLAPDSLVGSPWAPWSDLGWGEFEEVGQDYKITRLSFDNLRLSFDISDVLGTGVNPSSPKQCILAKETLKSDRNSRKYDIFFFAFLAFFAPLFFREKSEKREQIFREKFCEKWKV